MQGCCRWRQGVKRIYGKEGKEGWNANDADFKGRDDKEGGRKRGWEEGGL